MPASPIKELPMTEVSAPTGRSRLDLAAWRRRLQNPLTVATGALAAIYLIDGFDQLAAMIAVAVGALANTAPYIAIAVLLIGLLKATGAEVVVARAFQGRESGMIVMAALLGGLAPFCSCEVIPFIAGLLAVGAPLSAVMAFWLSSPLIDPPTLFVTAAALGWPFAIGKAVAAVGLGLFGGFAMRALVAGGAFADPLRERRAGGCCGVRPSPFSGQVEWAFWRDPARRLIFRQEAGGNAWFLLKWLTLAYVLEAVMIEYVPAAWVAGTVGGDGLGAIAIAAVVGMPAYLNGYAAPALLAGLTTQGMSAGAAMAFLVAGAVSSIPAMAAVFSLVKRPVFASYLILGLGGAILSGVIFQAVYSVL